MTIVQRCAVLGTLLASSVPWWCAAGMPAFERRVLTDKYFCDGINTGDFNRDGRPDIVAGPY